MKGQNFNAPHRPRFVRAGTYDIEIQATRLFEVVPVEGLGRGANGSEATVFATITSDGNFKVCRELTRFVGQITRDGPGYSRTVRFVMEHDGLLSLTAIHDAMTVFEWGAVLKPVEPAEASVEISLPMQQIQAGDIIQWFAGLKCTVTVPRGGKRRVVLFVKPFKGPNPKLWWIDPSQLLTLVQTDDTWILGEYEVSETAWGPVLPERQAIAGECPIDFSKPRPVHSKQYRMAKGLLYEAMIAAGWTDEHMVKHGHMADEQGNFRGAEPDPTTLQGAAELAARTKQALKEASERRQEAYKALVEAERAEGDARQAFGEAGRNLAKVAGASEED